MAHKIRLIGSKFDYIRRYAIIDLRTNKRVDGVSGGVTKEQAEDMIEMLDWREGEKAT